MYFILTWIRILKSHEEQLYRTQLASLFYINDLISKDITPCLVSILNDTAVSMVCSSTPCIEEIRSYIYQYVCRPQDVTAISVVCYPKLALNDYSGQQEADHHCWCREIHFVRLHRWSTLSNIQIFNKFKCHIKQVYLPNLISFELSGLNITKIDFSRLRQASIIVLHNSLTTPPSLLDLVRLHSLRLLSIRNHNFSSILQQWKQQSRFIQTQPTNQSYVMEVLDLEIICSNVVHIPDRLFTIISVKVSLSLCNNSIQTISAETFVGLTYLRALYLNDNNISHIHKTAFKPLSNMN